MRNGIIIETTAYGNSLKVTAIDAATGIEATIVADKRTTDKQREAVAIRKLQWVMKKKAAAKS